MAVETYQCDECQGTFPVQRTNEDADKEYQKLFPTESKDAKDRALLCEPCFVALMKKAEKVGMAPANWREYVRAEYRD